MGVGDAGWQLALPQAPPALRARDAPRPRGIQPAGVKRRRPRRYDQGVNGDLRQRLYDFFLEDVRRAEEGLAWEQRRSSLLAELRAERVPLTTAARVSLAARGLRGDVESVKREAQRLRQQRSRGSVGTRVTSRHAESLAPGGRSASECSTLEGMTNPPTHPRYRKTTTTEVVEHFLDPEEALDGLGEEFDDDEDFDEDAP